MSSPVIGSDFIIASQSQSLCERLSNLLGLSSKMKLWFDWAFDSNGDATNDLKAMFLPPPGTIMAYYLKAPEATVKSTIAMLGRAAGDTGDPFWVLCDGDSTYGSNPDLRGRVIVGGGAGTGLTNRSVDGSVFGAETITIGQSNIPTKDHYHGVGDTWTPNYTVDDDLTFIQRRWTDPSGQSWGQSVLRSVEAGSSGARNTGFIGTTNAIAVDSTDSGTVSPVSIIPPAMSVWYMMRTPRIA